MLIKNINEVKSLDDLKHPVAIADTIKMMLNAVLALSLYKFAIAFEELIEIRELNNLILLFNILCCLSIWLYMYNYFTRIYIYVDFTEEEKNFMLLIGFIFIIVLVMSTVMFESTAFGIMLLMLFIYLQKNQIYEKYEHFYKDDNHPIVKQFKRWKDKMLIVVLSYALVILILIFASIFNYAASNNWLTFFVAYYYEIYCIAYVFVDLLIFVYVVHAVGIRIGRTEQKLTAQLKKYYKIEDNRNNKKL